MTLEEDVTIIISLKDIFINTKKVLDFIVTHIPPKLKVIYVTTNNLYEKELVETYSHNYSNFHILESKLKFPCPFELRNMAISHVTTKYIYFMYNDVIPVKDDWLIQLYQSAENIPTGMIFSPFIWETKNNQSQFHAGWSDLYFIERDNRYYTIHPFDNKLKRLGIDYFKNKLEPLPQPFHIEDHAFLARTNFMKKKSIMDPYACYTKEFIDMALNMRYRKAETWLVPKSEVSYILSYGTKLVQNDLIYFTYRRSEELAYQTVNYIRQKWGIEYPYDGICRDFINNGLSHLKWTQDKLPFNHFKQFELVLAMFTAMGFNRFQNHELPKFYEECKSKVPVLNIKVNRVIVENNTQINSDWNDDNIINQRKLLREGKLGPVKHKKNFFYPKTPIEKFYQPFTLLKVTFEKKSDIPASYFQLASLLIKNREQKYDLYIYFLKTENLNLIYSENKLFGISTLDFHLKIYNQTDIFNFTMEQLLYWAWNPLKV